MNPLRILHAVPSLDLQDGGPARSVPALAAAQAALGADVTVCSRKPASINLQTYEPCRFASGDIRAFETHSWRPDIVHDHGLWLNSNHSSARLARHLRIPRVVSPRGMLEPWCLQHRRLRKSIAWQLYQLRDLQTSACLHATSESEARQFRRLGFEQPVVKLPNGVALPEFERCVTGRKNNEFVFLGRIHPVKGIANLLEAWRLVNRTDCVLKIVGNDEDDHLSKLRQHPAVTEGRLNVQFCPAVHTSEKWTLLAEAATVILPSYSENFGIVAAEALACGTPVIASTGTPWSGLTTHRCGWHVAPTAEAIADALRASMSVSSEQREAMGTRGRNWMQREFSWSEIADRMLQSYDWLLGRTQATLDQIDTPTQRAAA
ncbi:MAG: glycosyltransferase [Fuerstiella sp.]